MKGRRVGSPRAVALVGLLGVAATSFPITVLSASLPRVADDLGAGDTATAWVITAPLLAMAVLTPVAGKLGDLYGHRQMFLAGYLISGVLHVVTALSTNVGMLILWRTVSAAVAAPTGPSSLAILLRVYPTRRNQVMGWWSATVAAAPALGVVAGGPIVDALGWQVLFAGQAVLTMAAVAMAWAVLPSVERRRDVRFDLPGAMTLGAGIGLSLVAVNRGPEWGWASSPVVISAVTGPLLLAAFTVIQRRSSHPLLPPEIMRRGYVLLLFASQILLQVAYMGGFVVSPFLFDRVFGLGLTATSLMMLWRPSAYSAASAWSGRTGDRRPPRTAATVSAVAMAAALALTGLAAHLEILVLVVVAMTLTGIGQGYSRPIVMTAVSRTVDDHDLGVASGLFQMVMQLGAAIGISTLTTFVGDATAPSRFGAVYAIAAAVTVGGAATTWLALGRIRLDPAPPGPGPDPVTDGARRTGDTDGTDGAGDRGQSSSPAATEAS